MQLKLWKHWLQYYKHLYNRQYKIILSFWCCSFEKRSIQILWQSIWFPPHWWWRTQWEGPWCLQLLTTCPQTLLLCPSLFCRMLGCQSRSSRISSCFSIHNLNFLMFKVRNYSILHVVEDFKYYLLIQEDMLKLSWNYCIVSTF